MRIDKLKKTKYLCVYEIIANDTTKQYIVRFSYLGKNYGERNFSNLFGVRTAKQAFDKLQVVKVEIANGNNPFIRKIEKTFESYFNEHLKTLQNKVKFGDKYNTNQTYKKYIKEPLGNKIISSIEEKDITKILSMMDANGLGNRRKLDVKTVLRPIFNMAMKNQIINFSPLDDIKFGKVKAKPEITYRVIMDLETTAQTLYNNIMKIENVQDKIILCIALMTARRKSEILKLDYSYIKGDKVFVPSEIAKTANVDEFPLPKEVLSLIPLLETSTGKLFTCNNQRPTLQFNKIVKLSNIKFTEDNTITFHDTRNLFSTIMAKTEGVYLVDRCLSHTQAAIMTKYMAFGYRDRKKVFEKYWDILRG